MRERGILPAAHPFPPRHLPPRRASPAPGGEPGQSQTNHRLPDSETKPEHEQRRLVTAHGLHPFQLRQKIIGRQCSRQRARAFGRAGPEVELNARVIDGDSRASQKHQRQQGQSKSRQPRPTPMRRERRQRREKYADIIGNAAQEAEFARDLTHGFENPGTRDRARRDDEHDQRDRARNIFAQKRCERTNQNSFTATTKPPTTIAASDPMNRPKCCSSFNRIGSPK